MTVITGKTIRVEILGYVFDRCSDTPGLVTVKRRKMDCGEMGLPTHEGEMEAFIAAYRRVVAEDIEYRRMEHE